MSDIPPALRAALADRYEILRELGSGGMATVYLANDLKHARQVALKVLKPELALAVGTERFLTEIRTTANLQHPHILPLFDSGEADGSVFYVMPFVEGESLQDRLAREGQLPVEDAVRIARDVADALAHAHRAGVIHRDIKPANILLRDGRPLVADFGISLALNSAGQGRLTETGLSLGTPYYMSPEQATGDRDVDPRSDIYALGCVLYELLAGQPPFDARTAQAILARILTEEARPLRELRRSVPEHVADAVSRALEKLPADRFKDAGAFSSALADPGFRYPTSTLAAASGSGNGGSRPSNSRWAATVPWMLAGLLAVVAVVLAATRPGTPTGADLPPPVAFALDQTDMFFDVDVGRDGSVVWVAGQRVYRRPPGSTEARPIPGVEDAVGVAMDPEARRIAYSDAEGNVSVVSLDTGLRTRVWDVQERDASGRGLAWSEDGWIYLTSATDEDASVMRVSGVGGEPERVWTVPATDSAFPAFAEPIPGRSELLVTLVQQDPFVPSVIQLDPVSGDTTLIADNAGGALWSSTGHIVYAEMGGSLVALPWDVKGARATGPLMRLANDLGTDRSPRLALSAQGHLAYVSGPPISGDVPIVQGYFLNVVSPDGGVRSVPVDPTDHPDGAISQDGRLIAYTRENDLWIIDLDLGSHRRLTEGETGQHDPVWSPGGDSIAYTDHQGRIAIRAADGTGEARVLPPLEGYALGSPEVWSRDGTLLVYAQGDQDSGRFDIVIMPIDGSAPARPVLDASWAETNPTVSPDGRWIAYLSDREGRVAAYVRRWPDLRDERRISPEGERITQTARPSWTPDGSAVVIALGTGGTSRTAAIELSPEDGEVVAVREIFFSNWTMTRNQDAAGNILTFHPGLDPSRFSVPEQLKVIANWHTVLRERESEVSR